jgi:hypothetical protein
MSVTKVDIGIADLERMRRLASAVGPHARFVASGRHAQRERTRLVRGREPDRRAIAVGDVDARTRVRHASADDRGPIPQRIGEGDRVAPLRDVDLALEDQRVADRKIHEQRLCQL